MPEVGTTSTVAGGRYDEHLARFDGLFPGDQLLVTLHDDLNSDSSSLRAQLATFLGLATPIPAPRASVQNPYVEYRSHRARRLARKLPRPIAAAVFRVNTRRTDYPAMDPGVRRELATRFAPTKEAISARLGRELRWASP